MVWGFVWWAFPDLNWGPADYESDALTNWAKGPELCRWLIQSLALTARAIATLCFVAIAGAIIEVFGGIYQI